MNIFQNIKNYFRREKEMWELWDDVQNMDEVLLEKRLEIFKEVATPKFAKIGFTNWNEKYIWFSDFNEDGIKHVIQYHPFKGYTGSFSYGICFDFIPTISGKKLVNHRTEKSTKIIFQKLLEGWQNYKEGKKVYPYKLNMSNKKKLRLSLDKVLWHNTPKIEKWFNANQTIDQVTHSLLEDIKNPPFMYEFEKPIIAPEYIIAFVYKKKNDVKSAEFWMNKYFEKKRNTSLEIQLIWKKLGIQKL